jgi:hypothetical protein
MSSSEYFGVFSMCVTVLKLVSYAVCLLCLFSLTSGGKRDRVGADLYRCVYAVVCVYRLVVVVSAI